ncbi:hypothetical protein GOV07_02040 [Candidatus Woesearchaeota archaeon]|nr:hypothetical protein [Candidatus Woesearchaeota archaeon]
MVDYTKTRIDWQLYLERKYPLFLSTLIHEGYRSHLFKATGFKLHHNLAVHRESITTFYKSGKELIGSNDFFAELVRKKDPRLKEWAERGAAANRTALSRMAGAAGQLKELYEEFSECFTFGTLIPYRLLDAIENGDLKAENRELIELFEPLRSRSYYLDYVEKVFRPLWKRAAEKAGVEASLCAFLTPRELEAALEGRLPDDIMKREHCVFWSEPETGEIVFNYDNDFPSKIGIETAEEEEDQVKGQGAYPGKARGRVRIVNDLADGDGFEDGDILVSINTHPSILPLLQQSAAVVSDEGGVMCHAAVLARELKKPCVIGTKHATKVFKDGDIIKVDADNGTVRKV